MIGIEIMCDVSGRKIEKCQEQWTRDSYVGFHLQIVSQLFWGLFCGQARQSKPETGPGSSVAHQTTMPPSCRHREWRKV
jgi:hypothetical protein